MTANERTRASVVCIHRNRMLCVQLRDPSTRIARLFPPGGRVEAHETPQQAAVRETREETGYRVRLLPQRLHIARYPFTWDGQEFAVTTYFYAAELIDPSAAPSRVDDESYLEARHWLALEAIPFAFSYDPEILASIQRLLTD